MRHVVRSMILAGAIGGAPGAAEAAPVYTPTFGCNSSDDPAAGGSMTWGSGVSVQSPTIGVQFADGTTETSLVDCSSGQLYEPIERKSKPPNTDFLDIRMKEVFASPGIAPDASGGSPVTWTWFQQDVAIGDVVYVDTYFDLVVRHATFSPNGVTLLTQPSANRLTLRWRTAGAFAGLDQVSVAYDLALREIQFRAPLQSVDTRLDLLAASEVPEPAALSLLGAGLLGVAGLRRRRRTASG